MGYRLHFAKVHKVEWEGGYFSGNDVDDVRNLIQEYCDDSFWEDENSDIWEVGKEDFKAMIAKLRKNGKAKSEQMPEHSNAELADTFQEVLDGAEPDEDYIRFEWF